jgi:hypothetical protein
MHAPVSGDRHPIVRQSRDEQRVKRLQFLLICLAVALTMFGGSIALAVVYVDAERDRPATDGTAAP